MHGIRIVRCNHGRLYVHGYVVIYFEIMHVCKYIGIDYLQEIESGGSYYGIVSVASVYVSIPFGRLSRYRHICADRGVGIGGFVVYSLESYVIGVVGKKKMYRPYETAPIDRYLEEFSIIQYVPGLSNKAFFDCNPPGKSHWSYRMFVQKLNPADNTPLALPEQYAMMRINPVDNKENLPPGYIDDTLGTLSLRQRRRFLEGQWQDEVEGALWNSEIIDRNRVVNPPELLRVVIGVDPAVTAGKSSDLTGIVGAGTSADGHYYILADRSCRVNPLEWGREVIKLYRELKADRVIGEVNNGGDLIRTMLCELSPGLPFQAVSARRGKVLRAEPVAALYEKNLVHHAGVFTDLEEEMCSYSPLTAVKSPDRLDALVWAVAALSEPREKRFILA